MNLIAELLVCPQFQDSMNSRQDFIAKHRPRPDLADGNRAPRTKASDTRPSSQPDSAPDVYSQVHLTRAKPDELCQTWRFTRCTAAKDAEKEKIARGETQPVISETIIVSEGKEHITTTRTTTTTTVTTVPVPLHDKYREVRDAAAKKLGRWFHAQEALFHPTKAHR